MNPGLELTGEEFRALVRAAADRVADYLDVLPDQPAFDLEGAAEVVRSLAEPVPEEGAAVEEILDLLFDPATLKGLNTAGPGYLAYIPGGGLPCSAVAALIAEAIKRNSNFGSIFSFSTTGRSGHAGGARANESAPP